MLVPDRLPHAADAWQSLKRWERRELGQQLRRLGLSYTEIAGLLPVAKSTLSGWCKDIELTPEQHARLTSLRPAQAVRRDVARRRREATVRRHQEVRSAAQREVQHRLADPLWLAGVVAYWGEGAKRPEGELRFSNSDPDMVALFVAWSMRYLAVPRSDFSIRLHLHDGQDEQDRISFWSRVTGVPPSGFGKSYVKAEGTGHRKNVLYNGTASIRVCKSGSAYYRVMGWIDGVRVIRAASSIG